MKDQFNYQTLHELEKDIELQSQASPAFAFFHREKTWRFFQNNQYRLSVLHKTMEEIRDKYVKKDDEGKLLTKNIDGKKLWDFDNEENEKKYLDEWNAFMQITFDINL